MGKAQSKRSVDITTETKKGPEGSEEVTGKLEKIEDIDQKQVNGDATPQEKNDAGGEKKDAPDETENEKDLTTEKTEAENTAAIPSSPTDGAGDQANTTANETSPKEDASGNAAKEGEEISPLADESLNKKTKKKKWSFRSISFGKKDKQKPAKAEGNENAAANATSNVENAAAAPVTNGDASETNKAVEGEADNANKQDDSALKANSTEENKTTEGEKVENGVAADQEPQQQQMNGQKTPTSTPTDEDKPIETVNETAANTVATTVITSASAVAAAAATANSNETNANGNHSEMKNSVEKIENIVSNGTAADAEKNGISHANDEQHNDVEPQHEEKKLAQSDDIIKSIPVDEKPHQNGTNGDGGIEEITAATKTLQIEVKTEHQIDNVNSTTTNTTTTNTTIPADNSYTEQKTTTDNILIQTTTSLQTDTPPYTITNTQSDNTLSSKNSIDIIEQEQEQQADIVCIPKTVLEDIEEISKVAVDHQGTEEEEEEGINIVASEKDVDALQQQQQQQPPPLPLSAPPSQVMISALEEDKDNENENNSDMISSENSEPSSEKIEEIEIIETQLTDLETLNTTKTIEIMETLSLPEEISNELTNNCEKKQVVEIIVTSPNENLETNNDDDDVQIQESTGILDDFAAEALIIVDQIQKDLEKEEIQESESEKSVNDNADDGENADLLSNKDASTEFLIELVSNHETKFDDDIIKPIGTETPSNDSVNSETQEESAALSSFSSENKNEIEIDIQEENRQLENEINSKNTQLSEQEIVDEQNNQQSYDKEIEEKDEIIENEINEEEDWSKKIKTTEFSVAVDANGGDNKMNMNVVSVNDNVEEYFVNSTNKELPTAKDLKENAAAAEITTQDLPVTCE